MAAMNYPAGADDKAVRRSFSGSKRVIVRNWFWQFCSGLLMLACLALSIALWTSSGHSASCNIHLANPVQRQLPSSDAVVYETETKRTQQPQSDSTAVIQAKAMAWNVDLGRPVNLLSRSHINHIVVLGERHSGTNHLTRLLSMSLDLSKVSVTAGWYQGKHHLQPIPNQGTQLDVLIIGCVRNVYDWMLAMHKTCYCCEHMQSPKTDFTKFMSMQFTTRFSADCDTPDTNSIAGGRPWNNIMEARVVKLNNYRHISRVGHRFELFRLEDVWQAGASALDMVILRLSGYDLPWVRPPADLVAKALESDSRAWYGKSVNTASRIDKSVYLSPEKQLQDPKIKAQVELINRMRNNDIEAWAGYTMLQVPQNPLAQSQTQTSQDPQTSVQQRQQQQLQKEKQQQQLNAIAQALSRIQQQHGGSKLEVQASDQQQSQQQHNEQQQQANAQVHIPIETQQGIAHLQQLVRSNMLHPMLTKQNNQVSN